MQYEICYYAISAFSEYCTQKESQIWWLWRVSMWKSRNSSPHLMVQQYLSPAILAVMVRIHHQSSSSSSSQTFKHLMTYKFWSQLPPIHSLDTSTLTIYRNRHQCQCWWWAGIKRKKIHFNFHFYTRDVSISISIQDASYLIECL